MGVLSGKLSAKEGGRRVVLAGAGEDEANGLYLEAKQAFDGKPQFLYAGRTRSNAQIVLSFAASGGQWSLRKEASGIGATSKLWYVASAATGAAGASGEMPPATGWAASAEAGKRAVGEARYSIDPPPTLAVLAGGADVPEDVAKDMEERGAKYAADGE
uniref:Uncharacterized protein n=1 Tax=Phaeomonas parva TaxID=124430 RepID=A0A7S1TXC8_9STRA|mmetsp:Transcript_21767/g.66646  ORF Transcript_21767/g.66646 Transcript_21767/m.66646 type:complete len:159 (+) Transcript_21767:155-631(+)